MIFGLDILLEGVAGCPTDQAGSKWVLDRETIFDCEPNNEMNA
jgi:hypothetical protein